MRHPNRSLLLALALFAGGVTAHLRADEAVLVVRGTSSMPNAGERNYGRRVAERLHAWMTDVGLPAKLVSDDDLINGVPRTCRVLLLAYNPRPTPAMLASLKNYFERGGKTIVFYSASEPLARLLGMRLGEYQGFRRRGHWSSIRFNTASIAHLPAAVRQHSRNIRAPRPIPGQSRTIAEWYSDDGRPTGDPAWVASDRGAWMSHILLDDEDVARKQMMVAAFVARHLPALWKDVAAAMAKTAPALRPGMTFGESVEEIRRRANTSGRHAAIEPMIRSARATYRKVLRRSEANEQSGVITSCQSLSTTLASAFATAQSPRWPEWRGVWDHDGTGLHAGDWHRTARELSELGITDVLSNVLWPGRAHFPCEILQASDVMTMHGDQVAQAIAATRAHGLRFHAWKVCWKLGPGTDALRARLGAEGRLQITDQGTHIPWLCPTQPANRQFELGGLRTILRKYDVTGIHLDYIRYPDSHSCFCGHCKDKFARDTGVTVARWPRAMTGDGVHAQRFRDWRARHISTFVEACRKLINTTRPDVRLSAAVYGRYPLCRDSVAQDWLSWLKNDWVDFLCPMNYTEETLRFAAYVSGQVQACETRAGRLFPGIGVTANESRLSGVEVIDQVNVLRDAGARGFVLFDLNPILVRDVLPLLRMGVLAPPADR